MYDFSNETKWPVDKLTERYGELTELGLVPHGEERRAEIGREMAHLIFELGFRNVLDMSHV